MREIVEHQPTNLRVGRSSRSGTTIKSMLTAIRLDGCFLVTASSPRLVNSDGVCTPVWPSESTFALIPQPTPNAQTGPWFKSRQGFCTRQAKWMPNGRLSRQGEALRWDYKNAPGWGCMHPTPITEPLRGQVDAPNRFVGEDALR